MICGNSFSTAMIQYQGKSVYLTLKMNSYIHRITHHIGFGMGTGKPVGFPKWVVWAWVQ